MLGIEAIPTELYIANGMDVANLQSEQWWKVEGKN